MTESISGLKSGLHGFHVHAVGELLVILFYASFVTPQIPGGPVDHRQPAEYLCLRS